MKNVYLSYGWFVVFVCLTGKTVAQMPQPTVPDNLLNSTNTIGLPAAASREGTSEVVNLTNGALNFLLPVLTLPQRDGVPPLVLGFTYDSNQTNIQQDVSVSVQPWGAQWDGSAFVDQLDYSVGLGQITTTGLPLDWNIPQLIGSLEYEGDWIDTNGLYSSGSGSGGVAVAGPRVCMTNLGFKDWQGTVHTFPTGLIACSFLSEGGAFMIPTDISADNQGYYLDATHVSDIVVYAPDGTAYHFSNSLSGYQSTINYPDDNDLGGISNSAQQALHAWMSYSIDRFGNKIGFGASSQWGGRALIDTLGRQIGIQNDPTTGTPVLRYKDANGNNQSVTASLGLPAADSTIPQATGHDAGMYFGGRLGNSCNIVAPQLDMPAPQYRLNVQNMPDDWVPPAQDASRQFTGIGVTFSATGQSYKLLFDSFGHLLRIRYPEGGYHRYDYAQYQAFYLTQGPIGCTRSVAQVSHRYECANSSGICTSTEEATTTYLPNGITVAPPSWDGIHQLAGGGDATNQGMEVREPDGSFTRHLFHTGTNALIAITPLETDTLQYSGSGSLLRTTHNDFAPVQYAGYTYPPGEGAYHPFPVKTTTTLSDITPSLTSYTIYQYDQSPFIPQFMVGNATYSGLQYIPNATLTTSYGFDGLPAQAIAKQWTYFSHTLDQLSLATTSELVTAKSTTEAFDRDELGRVVAFHVSGSDVPMATYVYTPDAWGRPLSIQDPAGHITSYSYTDSWRDTTCAPAQNLSSYISSITNSLSQTTKFVYDSCTGRLAKSTDPNGTEVSLTYDAASRVTRRQASAAASVMDDLEVMYTDGPAAMVSRTRYAAPNPAVTTTFKLDGLGRVYDQSNDSDPNGATHITTYFDPIGRVMAVTNPYRSQSDATYGLTSYVYDAMGRKTFECQPDNTGVNTATCAPSNRFLEWQFAGNSVTSFDENRNSMKHISDAFGNLVEVRELGSTLQPLNLITSYSYDGFGNLLSVVQHGNGQESTRNRSFTYDSLSRLTVSNNSETGIINYSYLDAGGARCSGSLTLLCSKTDANNKTTIFQYDSLNRVSSRSQPLPGMTAVLSSCYQYDSRPPSLNGFVGRLVNEWTQQGACPSSLPTTGVLTRQSVLAYDGMGRVTQSQQCVFNNCTPASPASLRQDYDLAGNLTFWTDGLNRNGFSQEFDGAGRLKLLTSLWKDSTHPQTLFSLRETTQSPCGLTATAGYNPAGELQNWILGSGLNLSRCYNSRLRVTGETVVHP